MKDIQGYFDYLETKMKDLKNTQADNVEKVADMNFDSFYKEVKF